MNKSFSKVITALFLAFTLAAAPVFTLSAYAADAPTLADTITAFGLSASVSGNTVTVTGSVSNPPSALSLDINSEVTVVWQAELTGKPGSGGYLILLQGGVAGDCGIFKMESGTISAVDCDGAIDGGSSNTDIIISGGTVSATSTSVCTAIKRDYGTGRVYITGGTVKVAGGDTGGNKSRAIYVGSGGVEISGGEVLAVGAPNNYAFYSYHDPYPIVNVTGGLVFGYGSSTGDIIHSNVTLTNNGGTVLVWDKTNYPGPFTAGDTDGIDVDPPDSAVWGRQSGVGGIIYDIDKFLPIPGVMVQAKPTAPQNLTATPGNEQVTLSWAAPADDGGDAIAKYEVSKDNGASWEDAASDTGHTFTGLTNGTPYTFKVRAVNSIGAGEEASATATPTDPDAPVTSGSSGDSGDSGDSGSSGGKASAIKPISPMWLERIPAAILACEAKRENRNFVRTEYGYQFGVRGNAWDRLANLQYQHDTMDGKSVQVRLYVNEPEKFTKDTLVSGFVKGNDVNWIKSCFEKWFGNKVRVIHFDQQGDWERPVSVAAKVDLTGMDTGYLYFYAYDKNANSYRRIEKPAYWIDKNGYLRFSTKFAGDIIISEGPLYSPN